MKIALYARTSKDDGEMTPETQLLRLRTFATERGYEIVKEYIDTGWSGVSPWDMSGSKKTPPNCRPALSQLITDCNSGKYDAILVYRFDRISRVLSSLLIFFETMKFSNTKIISYSENFDTSTPAGMAMMQMAGIFAEFERNLIVERTNVGIARARAQGKVLGRPRKSVDLSIVNLLISQGLTNPEISKRLNISLSTLEKALEKNRNNGGEKNTPEINGVKNN